MIGLKIKHNDSGDGFTVTGVDGSDRLVLTPDEFGAPIGVPLEEFRNNYSATESDTTLPDALPPTEADVITKRDARATAEANRRYAQAAARGRRESGGDVTAPPEGSPEAVFAELATEPTNARPRRRKTT